MKETNYCVLNILIPGYSSLIDLHTSFVNCYYFVTYWKVFCAVFVNFVLFLCEFV